MTETAGAQENDGAVTSIVSSSPRRPPESANVPASQQEQETWRLDQIPEVPIHCRGLPRQKKGWSNPISKTMIIATKTELEETQAKERSRLCNDCLDLLLYPASAQSKEKKGILENPEILP